MTKIKVGDTVIVRKPEDISSILWNIEMDYLHLKKIKVTKIDEAIDCFYYGDTIIFLRWCEKVKPKKSKKKRIKKLEKEIKRLDKTIDMLLGDYLDKYMDVLL